MTTIRDEMPGSASVDGCEHATAILAALGIDPDLPAEWATVDRCLTWLREQDKIVVLSSSFKGGTSVSVADYADALAASKTQYGRARQDRYDAPTLHAALIAACRAVQEAAA